MFDGSLIKNNRTKTPAGMVIAVAGQVSAIGLAVLIPLVYTEHLPAFTTPASITVAKGKPDRAHAEIKSAGPNGPQAVRSKASTPLTASARIPEQVAPLIDQPGLNQMRRVRAAKLSLLPPCRFQLRTSHRFCRRLRSKTPSRYPLNESGSGAPCRPRRS